MRQVYLKAEESFLFGWFLGLYFFSALTVLISCIFSLRIALAAALWYQNLCFPEDFREVDHGMVLNLCMLCSEYVFKITSNYLPAVLVERLREGQVE